MALHSSRVNTIPFLLPSSAHDSLNAPPYSYVCQEGSASTSFSIAQILDLTKDGQSASPGRQKECGVRRAAHTHEKKHINTQHTTLGYTEINTGDDRSIERHLSVCLSMPFVSSLMCISPFFCLIARLIAPFASDAAVFLFSF